MPTFVTISGTSRPDNYTARALAVVEAALGDAGATVEAFDARELTLAFPGHDPTPDAERLTAAVEGAAGVVLATPEYHGTFCAMAKLILENMGFPSALRDKPIALLGVAAGRIGAIKSLEHLRSTCAHMGAIVLPRAVSIAGVRSLFDADGRCTDEGTAQVLRGLGDSLAQFHADFVRPKHCLEAMAREGSAPGWTIAV